MIPTTIIKTVKVPSQFLGELKGKTNSNVADENVTVRSYGPAMAEATDYSVKACYIVGGSLPVAEGIFHVLSENSKENVDVFAEDVHQIYVNAGNHSVTLEHVRAMMSLSFTVHQNGGISYRREMKAAVGKMFADEKMVREKIRVSGHHLAYGYRFISKKK